MHGRIQGLQRKFMAEVEGLKQKYKDKVHQEHKTTESRTNARVYQMTQQLLRKRTTSRSFNVSCNEGAGASRSTQNGGSTLNRYLTPGSQDCEGNNFTRPFTPTGPCSYRHQPRLSKHIDRKIKDITIGESMISEEDSLKVASLHEVRKQALRMEDSYEQETEDDDDDDEFNALRTDRLKKVTISNAGRSHNHPPLRRKGVDVSFHVKTNKAKSKERANN